MRAVPDPPPRERALTHRRGCWAGLDLQASVTTSCTSPSMVVQVIGPEGNVLCKVDQRKLYRKNGWPAKTDIVKALMEMPLDS